MGVGRCAEIDIAIAPEGEVLAAVFGGNGTPEDLNRTGRRIEGDQVQDRTGVIVVDVEALSGRPRPDQGIFHAADGFDIAKVPEPVR
jgi:hypothetical protein